MLAMLMGLSTLVGFDAAANLAEEAKDPYRNVPRAIVGVGRRRRCAGIAVPDRAHGGDPRRRDESAVADRRSPTSCATSSGQLAETTLLVAIAFAFFACGMVMLATGARLVYAMARDRRFPMSTG